MKTLKIFTLTASALTVGLLLTGCGKEAPDLGAPPVANSQVAAIFDKLPTKVNYTATSQLSDTSRTYEGTFNSETCEETGKNTNKNEPDYPNEGTWTNNSTHTPEEIRESQSVTTNMLLGLMPAVLTSDQAGLCVTLKQLSKLVNVVEETENKVTLNWDLKAVEKADSHMRWNIALAEANGDVNAAREIYDLSYYSVDSLVRNLGKVEITKTANNINMLTTNVNGETMSTFTLTGANAPK